MKFRLPKKKESLNIGLAAAIIGSLLLFLFVDLPKNNYEGVLKAYPASPVFADISADRTLAAINDSYKKVYVIDYETQAIKYMVDSEDISENADIFDVILNDRNELFLYAMDYDPDTGMLLSEYIVCCDGKGNVAKTIALPPVDDDVYDSSISAFHFEGDDLYCVANRDEVYSILRVDLESGKYSVQAEYENEEAKVSKWVSAADDGSYYITWDNGEFGVLSPDGTYEKTDSFDFRLREDKSSDNILIDLVTACGDKVMILDGGYWDTVYTYEDGELVPYITLKDVYDIGEMSVDEYSRFTYNNLFFPLHNEEGELGIISHYNLILTDGNDMHIIDGKSGYALPLGNIILNISRPVLLVVGTLLTILGTILILGSLMKWRLSVLTKLLLIVLPIVLIAIFVIANTVIKKTENTYYETEYDKYIAIADFIRSNIDADLIKEIDDLEDKDNGNVDLLEENLYDILSADSTGWSDSIEVTIYSYDKYGMNRSLVSSTGVYNFLDYNLMLTLNQLELKRIKNTDVYVTDTNAYYNHYTDVFSLIRGDDGEILAIVNVSDDFAELERNLDEVKMNIIIQTVALMIVLVIFMIILSLYINKNLRRTSVAIREIGEGNYDEKIEKISNDELGDIAKSVNNMADRIKIQQQSIITGMSTMVESRDNSTGGHIRRTSLIINEFSQTLKEHEHSLGINDKFIQDLTKAAPMHDLGKIAVDDDVLRKPGKYTEDEYDKMKEHALEGARIIEKLLEDSDDREFAEIATNVAHYHHEKWNGTGYPEGLKGKDIPIEARIMALADVFDALVSKRCYKEAFDYETAYNIIRDDCGTHFDPELGELFLSCYEKFEKLYDKMLSEEE